MKGRESHPTYGTGYMTFRITIVASHNLLVGACSAEMSLLATIVACFGGGGQRFCTFGTLMFWRLAVVAQWDLAIRTDCGGVSFLRQIVSAFAQ